MGELATDAVAEADGETDGTVADTDAVAEPEGESESEADEDGDGVSEAEGDGECVSEAEGDGEGDTERVPEEEDDGAGVSEEETEGEGVSREEPVGDTVTEGDGVTDHGSQISTVLKRHSACELQSVGLQSVVPGRGQTGSLLGTLAHCPPVLAQQNSPVGGAPLPARSKVSATTRPPRVKDCDAALCAASTRSAAAARIMGVAREWKTMAVRAEPASLMEQSGRTGGDWRTRRQSLAVLK